MFREIDAECYIMVDGDDTYPAEYALELCEYILNKNADMVVGDRLSSTYLKENKRLFHNVGNLLVRKSIQLLFRCDIKDIMTGYRAFSYRFVKTFPVLSKGFEIETEMSIHAIDKNLHIANVVVGYRDRPEGSESKLNTYSDGIKVILTIQKLFRNYKPLTFFGLLSLFFIVLAGLFFLPVLISYFQTGEVDKFPTLIVCGFTSIAAIQSFFTGLILDVNVQKDKQDFEYRLNQVQNQYQKK